MHSSPRLDFLDVQKIREIAPDHLFTRALSVLSETTSTNDVVHQLARQGAEEGVCVAAERQTAGRGRHGRAWESAQSLGLWFSLLLRPQWPAAQLPRVTLSVGLAVLKAIERVAHLPCNIKWPNDVLIQGKKVCGILTEARFNRGEIDYAVVGIGINVNQQSEHFAELPHATSLFLQTQAAHDRHEVLAVVLREIEKIYRTDFEQVAGEWESHCANIGQILSVKDGVADIQGQMMGIDPDGALLLRLESGQVRAVRSGEVVVN